MTRHLLLMRHGLTHNSSPDFDRSLKEKGKRDAQRVGVYLAQHGLRPDHAVASSAIRTTTTAQKCLKAAGLGTDILTLDDLLYNADPLALRQAITRTPEQAACVLLVAHNPGITELAFFLLGEALIHSSMRGAMSPGMMIHITFEGPWSRLKNLQPVPHFAPACTLQTVLDPDTLPRDFPFPDPLASDLSGPSSSQPERRPRPAYYYTQSCALPYRIRDKQVEVLCLTSSGGRHWTLPKGIVDPGLSPAASATQEAREEGGIVGQIVDTPLGHYTVEKWEGLCHVSVYPLPVEQLLPPEEWEENHRTRQWFPQAEAAKHLKNQALANLVRTFQPAEGAV